MRGDSARVAPIFGLAAAVIMVAYGTSAQSRRVQPNALSAPVLFTTTVSTTTVHVTWSSVPGATVYDVYRRANGGAFAVVLTLSSTAYTDSVTPNATYYYKVVARNSTESVSSNVDLATTVAFRDDPIEVERTVVRDDHVTELRTAVNYARTSAGLAAATWQHATLAQQPVYAEDIEELRAALNEARSTAGMAATTFSDAPLVKQSTLVRKAHVKELRQALKGVQPGGLLTVTSVAASEPYFSPNADGVKDATAISARISSADAAWTVSVKTGAGATIRSASGFGSTVSWTWDGRDGGGNVAPDASYTILVDAVDGIYTASGGASAVVDTTLPIATLTSPSTGQTYSNVRQNGSTSITAAGTATDANLASWDVAHERSGASPVTFGSGPTAISNSQFAVWKSDPAGNGAYTVRLQVRDKAGNVAVTVANLTVAHFSASQNVFQIKPSAGERITYTSIVPFAVTETLTIRNGAGVTVRTLVNASRAAGTYDDVWDGRSDTGAALPDGAYSYVAAVSEASNSFTWDTSGAMRGTSATQFPYPSCSGKSMPLDTCENHGRAGRQYDPFANDPLNIHYSVAEPSRVSVVLTSSSETAAVCGWPSVLCVVDREYRAAGQYLETWAAVLSSGAYDTTPWPYITVVRRTDDFPRNVVVLYGAGPPVRAKNLIVTPPLYSPEAGPMKIEVDVETFGAVTANVTMRMIRQGEDGAGPSVLRAVTLSNQAAGRLVYSWDGKSSSGHWVAPGDYALVVTATSGSFSSTVNTRFVVIY